MTRLLPAILAALLVGSSMPCVVGASGEQQRSDRVPIWEAGTVGAASRSHQSGSPIASPAASPTLSLHAPTIRGTASWYCLPGRSRCTRGVPASTMAVAVPWALRGAYPRGTRVRLCHGSRCVVARVVDVNVGPSWDCYAVVFARLAPLSAGRIVVTVGRVP